MINTKILGVIGGLGPLATAYFIERVVKMTDAKSDQEHLNMIIYNTPSIPDRTAYIIDNTKPNPFVPIMNIGKQLISLGAEIIVIPCITSYYFYNELSENMSKPLVNVLKATGIELKQRDVKTVGIMATDGTIMSRLFQTELAKIGITCITPSPVKQADVRHLIYNNIKAGKQAEIEKFHSVRDELKTNGAEVIILGCTELSFIKRDNNIGSGFIDAMDVLAKESVQACNGKLKNKYETLIF